MTDEKLIKEVAKAILNEIGGLPDELEQMHLDAAKAALAVFESQTEWEYGVRSATYLVQQSSLDSCRELVKRTVSTEYKEIVRRRKQEEWEIVHD